MFKFTHTILALDLKTDVLEFGLDGTCLSKALGVGRAKIKNDVWAKE